MKPGTILVAAAAALLLIAGHPSAQTATQTAEAKMLSSHEYTLPAAAAAAGIDGRVTVALTVDDAGAAKNVRITSGPGWACGSKPKKALDDVREDIVRFISAARFSPAVRDGKPAESDLIITFLTGPAYRGAIKALYAEDPTRTGAVLPTLIDYGQAIVKKAKNLSKPPYPPDAHSERASGVVPVEIIVDEKGNVIMAGAIGGHPKLQSAARDTACSGKFTPTTWKDQPVKASGIILYNFVPS